MRWSSHIANGCVPAEPIVSPGCGGSFDLRRSSRSWSPASARSGTGVVAISQTDSISSGFTSPSMSGGETTEQSLDRIHESSVSASTIMSSSSIPSV